jgi:hypothetical protein
MKSSALTLLLVTSAFAQSTAHSNTEIKAAAASIQLEDIKAKMMFLAGPEMNGRLVGSHENRISAEYIASQFKELGLKPAGDGDTYYQNFDLVSAWPDEEKGAVLEATIAGQQKSFIRGHDFDTWWVQSTKSESAHGPIEFLGYGINAPEYGYNDFAGVKLAGKIAMVFGREPQADDSSSRFRGSWDTYHSYDWFKIEQVRQAGAAGLLIVTPTFFFNESRIPSAPPNYTLPEPRYGLADSLWDLPIMVISTETANALLSASGQTVASLQKAIDDNLQPHSFEVPGVTVTASKAFKDHKILKARNVIGVLEGSDPELKKQYVVVSGHYDHAGTHGTRIYAGADDNASGTIGTIEIAQAFVRSGIKPKRSIVFACFDAEEEGLYGSAYYIMHPTVPIADTVANLNMDMIGRDEESFTWHTTADQNRNSVNIVGTLYDPDVRKVIEDENKQVGLKLDYKTDTRDPEQWFARSDHFWFATRSVPQVLFNTGGQSDYHTENDTAARINYPKMTKIVQLIFLSTAQIADTPQKPRFAP